MNKVCNKEMARENVRERITESKGDRERYRKRESERALSQKGIMYILMKHYIEWNYGELHMQNFSQSQL